MVETATAGKKCGQRKTCFVIEQTGHRGSHSSPSRGLRLNRVFPRPPARLNNAPNEASVMLLSVLDALLQQLKRLLYGNLLAGPGGLAEQIRARLLGFQLYGMRGSAELGTRHAGDRDQHAGDCGGRGAWKRLWTPWTSRSLKRVGRLYIPERGRVRSLSGMG